MDATHPISTPTPIDRGLRTGRRSLSPVPKRRSWSDDLAGLHGPGDLGDGGERTVRSLREGDAWAVVAVGGLDGMERIEAEFGSGGGDRLRRIAAGTLLASFGAEGYVARTGEDDFVVLTGALAWSERRPISVHLDETLAREAPLSGISAPVGFSVGVIAHDRSDPRSLAQLIGIARTRMHRHRRNRSGDGMSSSARGARP